MIKLKNSRSMIKGAATVAAAVGLPAAMAPASAAPTPTPGATLSVVTDIVNRAHNRLIHIL